MRDWRKTVELAEHYLAVGQREQWIFDSYGEPFDYDKPWEYITAIKKGSTVLTWIGTKTLEVCHDFKFMAEHPSGLTFTWDIEILREKSEGEYYRQLDFVKINTVAVLLSSEHRTKFLDLCLDYVEAIAEQHRAFTESVMQAQIRQDFEVVNLKRMRKEAGAA